MWVTGSRREGAISRPTQTGATKAMQATVPRAPVSINGGPGTLETQQMQIVDQHHTPNAIGSR